VTQCCIGFGIAFELPVVVLVLVRLGIVSVALLRRTRAYAFLLIFLGRCVSRASPGCALDGDDGYADVPAL